MAAAGNGADEQLLAFIKTVPWEGKQKDRPGWLAHVDLRFQMQMTFSTMLWGAAENKEGQKDFPP